MADGIGETHPGRQGHDAATLVQVEEPARCGAVGDPARALAHVARVGAFELDADTRDLWRDLAQVAAGTLPEWARDMYGFPAPPTELMERETVRQLLGALDLAFESLPGVLEARQRIELRMRAAE